MIDTLHLRLDQPRLRAGHKLTIQGKPELDGQPQGEGIQLQQEGGQLLQTGKVYYNGLVNVNSRYGELFLNVSLPKVKAEGKANVWPVSQAEALSVLGRANEFIQDEIGIITDLKKASVSRCDIFANADSVYSFNDYRSLFEMLNFKRQISRDYGSTFLFMNGQRETCIYDKKQEQADKGNETASLPANLIRWEYRLKKSSVCKPALNVPKRETLTATRLLTDFAKLVKVYDANLQNALKLEGSEGAKAEIRNLKSELLYAIKKAPNPKRRQTQGLELWLKMNGAKSIFARAGGYSAIWQILKELDYTSDQLKRFKADFYELNYGIQTAIDFLSINELKQELYTKLSMNYSKVA